MARVPIIYNDKDTILHRRDARIKILMFVFLVLFLYFAPTWQWMLGMTVLGLLLALISQMPKRFLLVLWLLQLPNILALVLVPIIGQLIASGGLEYSGRLAFGGRLSLAWSAALFVSVSLVSTMTVKELADGLRGLGLPEFICFVVEYVFLLVYRSADDVFRIANAMRAKGVDLEIRNPMTWITGIPLLMVPTIISVLRRAMPMMSVLEMRGFSATKRRKKLNLPKIDSLDISFLVGSVAVFVLAVGVRFGWLPPLMLQWA
ncbi:MAG: energy-coupling factor transporter transmembrane component T family protein [Leptolyngbyaceae cyanobacterium]